MSKCIFRGHQDSEILKRMDLPRLILPSDIENVGQDRRGLVALCNRGVLHRIRRGVYVESDAWQQLQPVQKYGLQTLAFQQLARRQPVLGHTTAALLWGLWIVGTPRQLHVMTEVTAGGRNENGVIRHRGSVTEGIVQCGPFLLTDKCTTVIQLITKLDFAQAVAVCDSSLRPASSKYVFNRFTQPGGETFGGGPVWQSTYPQGMPLHKGELVAAAALLPSRAATVRALAVIDFASGLSGSAGESMSRARMHILGFPAPVLQKKFFLRDGSAAFVDFWFKELNLAGEFDGREKYLRAGWGKNQPIQTRVLAEKNREDQIRAQGVRFVRWTWAEMLNRERFIALLHQAGLRQLSSHKKDGVRG